MNLKQELSKIIYSNHDRVPFEDTADECEQLFIKEMIEVLNSCIPNKWYESHETLVENKITELKSKLKQA